MRIRTYSNPAFEGNLGWSPTAHVKRQSSLRMILPSSLTCFSLGTVPVVVPLRPSSEQILIVRLQEQEISAGVIPPLIIVRFLRAKRMVWWLPIPPFQAYLLYLLWEGTHVGLRAAVERGPSEGARSGSTGLTWVSFQSFYRGGSVSKGD